MRGCLLLSSGCSSYTEDEQAGKLQLTTGTPFAFVIGATLPFIGAPAQQSACSIDQGNCWHAGHQLAVSV